eukprot:304476-Amphidinium_carterae.1
MDTESVQVQSKASQQPRAQFPTQLKPCTCGGMAGNCILKCWVRVQHPQNDSQKNKLSHINRCPQRNKSAERNKLRKKTKHRPPPSETPPL